MQYVTPVYLCLPQVTRSHQATSQFVQKLEETGTVNEGEKEGKIEEKEREEADKEANLKQVFQTQKAGQYNAWSPPPFMM